MFSRGSPGPVLGFALSCQTPGMERRLTVLCCRLHGSGEPALRPAADPPLLSDEQRQLCSEIVRHLDGQVAEFTSGGALVYFGYPRAHEDDPERALQAAVELARELPRQAPARDSAPSEALQLGVGVHCGPLRVEPVDGDGRREKLVLGQTVNVATLLCALAPPGATLVSDVARRLAGEAFRYESFDERALGAEPASSRIWRVQLPATRGARSPSSPARPGPSPR